MTDVTAVLTVADGVSSRPLDVDDFKAAATGDATEASLAAFLAANHTDLAAVATALASVLAKQSADPSTGAKQDTLHTDLAAVLAKISADPATQTTLAAVLAKQPAAPALEHATAGSPLSARLSDGTSYLGTTAGRLQVADGGVALSTAVSNFPATQPVSAAALPLPAGAATDAKSEAIRALLAGTLLVDSATPSGFALADAGTQVATVYHGLTVRETAGAAAVLRIRDTNVTGAILDTIGLVAGESRSEHYPRGRAIPGGTVYVQVVSGTVEGRVFYR